MFVWLGKAVTENALAVLIAWVVACAALLWAAPSFDSRASHGEFNFLPEDQPSRQAIDLYRRAFLVDSPGEVVLANDATPVDALSDGASNEEAAAGAIGEAAAKGAGSGDAADAEDAGDDAAGDEDRPGSVQQDPLGSNIVLLLRRATPLRDGDRDFLSETLIPEIRRIAEVVPSDGEAASDTGSGPQIRSIWTYQDDKLGPLLVSTDKKAMMVVVELDSEFMDRSNAPLLSRLEELVENVSDLRNYPTGLDLKISGSATVGRDMLVAEKEGSSRTELFTLILVIGLLSIMYRAPVLALIPLVTVAVAVLVTLRLLAALTDAGFIGVFAGLDVFVRVVMYGAGVDYALFILARYREELDLGRDYPEALATAVGKIGPALATSAGTSIVGIGMMCFAAFGKFRQSGFGISFGLLIVLIAALTFTPAVLRLFERYAFWPRIRTETVPLPGSWSASRSPWQRLLSGRTLRGVRERYKLRDFWRKTARRISERPGWWLTVSVVAMLPFVVVAVRNFDHLSYGLLSDLPSTEPSVVGAKAIQEHFPAGVAGPTTVLIYDPKLADERALDVSADLTDALTQQKAALRIADVRSQKQPLGTSQQARDYLASLDEGSSRLFNRKLIVRKQLAIQAKKLYLASSEELEDQVLRLDLVFNADPFDRGSIDLLDDAEQTLRAALPEGLRESAEIVMIGPTASIRDLKTVTDGDRTLICTLVTIAVYLVIVLLLRRPRICLFLIASVVLSYLATVGMTYAAFSFWMPETFAGLDWKVPIFLFTLLIALGEDYNILLMARIVEEQEEFGPQGGVTEALAKTGSIISSCGIIMAGTFASLLFGTLTSMLQMGFALTIGVLLDTFLVRPVIVPAWLTLLHDWQLTGGWKETLARVLGGAELVRPTEQERAAVMLTQPEPEVAGV